MTLVLAMGCGAERISHGDGGASDSSGDPTSTDDGSSGNADTSTGGAPPGTVPGEGPYGAGTRLKPVVERTEDGVAQLVHWYDTELGIDCEFVRDSVGTPRCLPLEVDWVTVGFASGECTEPVLGSEACGSLPTHVRGQVPGAADCAEGTRHQAYLRGASIGSGGVGEFTASSGDCDVGGYQHPERHALTPIADEDFVAAAVLVEDRGSALVRALVAEDGAFVRDRLVDPRTGTVCVLGPGDLTEYPSEDFFCQVPPVHYSGYSDDDCSTTLIRLPNDGTCETPSLNVVFGVETWQPVGEAWEGPRFESGPAGACEPIAPLTFDAYSYHSLGEKITQIDSPRFVSAIATDPGSLRRRGWRSEDDVLMILPGTVDDDSRWLDTYWEQGCQAAPDDDGTLRCFPLPFATPDQLLMWGDPECSETPLLYGAAFASDLSDTSITRVELGACGGIQVQGRQYVRGTWDGPVYGPNIDGSEPCEIYQVQEFEGFYELQKHDTNGAEPPVLELVTEG